MTAQDIMGLEQMVQDIMDIVIMTIVEVWASECEEFRWGRSLMIRSH